MCLDVNSMLQGLSALKIKSIQGRFITVDGLDILDGTPVIDIKPYIPAFDSFQSAKAGWMDQISTDMDVVRNGGYQEIYSARGARSTRKGNKRRQLQRDMQTNDALLHGAGAFAAMAESGEVEKHATVTVVNDDNK